MSIREAILLHVHGDSGPEQPPEPTNQAEPEDEPSGRMRRVRIGPELAAWLRPQGS